MCVRLGLFILFALQRGLCVLGLGCLYCMPYREASVCEAWAVYIVCLTERPLCLRLGLFILFALQRGLCV